MGLRKHYAKCDHEIHAAMILTGRNVLQHFLLVEWLASRPRVHQH